MSAQDAAEEEQIYTDAFLGERSWNGRERNQLLLNTGGGCFIETGSAFGLDSLADGRGLAASDFDHDGDVDFVVNNYKANAQVFENRVGERRPWLAVRLQGTRSNRDGIGAEVRVVTGSRAQIRVVGAGHGYASQYSLEQLFGLGAETKVDQVIVRWPGGVEESFGPREVNQRLLLVEGSGRAAAAPAPKEIYWLPALVIAVLGVFGFWLIRRPSPSDGQ